MDYQAYDQAKQNEERYERTDGQDVKDRDDLTEEMIAEAEAKRVEEVNEFWKQYDEGKI